MVGNGGPSQSSIYRDDSKDEKAEMTGTAESAGGELVGKGQGQKLHILIENYQRETERNLL